MAIAKAALLALLLGGSVTLSGCSVCVTGCVYRSSSVYAVATGVYDALGAVGHDVQQMERYAFAPDWMTSIRSYFLPNVTIHFGHGGERAFGTNDVGLFDRFVVSWPKGSDEAEARRRAMDFLDAPLAVALSSKWDPECDDRECWQRLQVERQDFVPYAKRLMENQRVTWSPEVLAEQRANVLNWEMTFKYGQREHALDVDPYHVEIDASASGYTRFWVSWLHDDNRTMDHEQGLDGARLAMAALGLDGRDLEDVGLAQPFVPLAFRNA